MENKYYMVKSKYICVNDFSRQYEKVILVVSKDKWSGDIFGKRIIIALQRKTFPLGIVPNLSKNTPLQSHIKGGDWGEFWEATRQYILRKGW